MTAQPLTPAEAATVARFDAAPPAPESYACTCGHEGLTAEWHADTCGRVGRAVTAVDLDAIDKLRAAATPGPWTSAFVDEQNPADAALIVAAVNALGELIADARRYRALRDAVEGLAERWEADADRHDDALPVSGDGLIRMILAARFARMNASDLRATLAAVDSR
jgi:hypothetical protein